MSFETYTQTKPDTIEGEIQALEHTYHQKMGNCDTNEREAIGEYYRMIEARRLPAYEWMMEAIHVTGKKEEGKRNINYMIGIIRKWLTHGFGYIPSMEEELIVGYIEEDYGVTLNSKARADLLSMLGKYGVVRLTREVSKVDIDLSEAIITALESRLDNSEKGGGSHANIAQ